MYVLIFRQWLFEVSHGIDLTPVKYKMISNSISCCKKFPGTSALKTMKDVYHWINELASELKDRLDSDVKMVRKMYYTRNVSRIIVIFMIK